MSDIRKVKRPDILVELGETQYPLKLTLESYGEIEERFGSVSEGLNRVGDRNMKATIFLLYAGFLHLEDPELTEKKIARAIDIRDLGYYMQKITEAVTVDTPIDEEKPETEQKMPNPN